MNEQHEWLVGQWVEAHVPGGVTIEGQIVNVGVSPPIEEADDDGLWLDVQERSGERWKIRSEEVTKL